jgi:hypothetical protein
VAVFAGLQTEEVMAIQIGNSRKSAVQFEQRVLRRKHLRNVYPFIKWVCLDQHPVGLER